MNLNGVNTEEAFVLATLKEFVKLWGSGNQDSFHLECKDRQASFKFSSLLGPPGGRHFDPHHTYSDDHGSHGGPPVHPPPLPRRKKGPSQCARDRAWAAGHQETKPFIIRPAVECSTASIESLQFKQPIASPPAPTRPPCLRARSRSSPPAATTGIPSSSTASSSPTASQTAAASAVITPMESATDSPQPFSEKEAPLPNLTSDRDIENEEAMEAVETNDKNEIENKCHKCFFILFIAGLKVHKAAMHIFKYKYIQNVH